MKEPVKKETGVSCPDGYKEVKCATCEGEWYVPEDCVPEGTAFICPDCIKDKLDAINNTKNAAEAALKS